MRKSFHQIIENGRIRTGVMASKTGERNGAFHVQRRGTPDKLTIISSDGKWWNEERLPGEPWEHVSISTPDRCPTWQEMSWVKSMFFEDTETVVEFHVPKADHIKFHPFVLHLWRLTKSAFPMPPSICLGPK